MQGAQPESTQPMSGAAGWTDRQTDVGGTQGALDGEGGRATREGFRSGRQQRRAVSSTRGRPCWQPVALFSATSLKWIMRGVHDAQPPPPCVCSHVNGRDQSAHPHPPRFQPDISCPSANKGFLGVPARVEGPVTALSAEPSPAFRGG